MKVFGELVFAFVATIVVVCVTLITGVAAMIWFSIVDVLAIVTGLPFVAEMKVMSLWKSKY